MRKFGLIGYPLGHSFSKKYFTEKFSREHIYDCSYENYPLTSVSQLPGLISSDNSIEGLNVTIPYKSDVINFLDEISEEAREIGAVNVLKIKRTKGKIKLCGFNSDITGILGTLKPFISSGLKGAIVLGTGGASKAVCHVLEKSGVKYTLISRNPKSGCLTYSDIDAGLIESIGLIVNTTPLGMFPDVGSRPAIDYSLLNKSHILFDLVYNPEKTSFLRSGEERGCSVISGIEMLHLQAEKAWQIWNENEY